MQKQETIEIDLSSGPGRAMLTQMDGNTATDWSVKLINMFGPGIVSIFSAMEGDQKDFSKVAASARELLNQLTVTEFNNLKRALFVGGQLEVNGEFHDLNPQTLGKEFAGHAGSLLKLVFFGLKLNFENFLSDLGIKKEVIAKLTVGIKAMQNSPKSGATAGTGQSGD